MRSVASNRRCVWSDVGVRSAVTIVLVLGSLILHKPVSMPNNESKTSLPAFIVCKTMACVSKTNLPLRPPLIMPHLRPCPGVYKVRCGITLGVLSISKQGPAAATTVVSY